MCEIFLLGPFPSITLLSASSSTSKNFIKKAKFVKGCFLFLNKSRAQGLKKGIFSREPGQQQGGSKHTPGCWYLLWIKLGLHGWCPTQTVSLLELEEVRLPSHANQSTNPLQVIPARFCLETRFYCSLCLFWGHVVRGPTLCYWISEEKAEDCHLLLRVFSGIAQTLESPLQQWLWVLGPRAIGVWCVKDWNEGGAAIERKVWYSAK